VRSTAVVNMDPVPVAHRARARGLTFKVAAQTLRPGKAESIDRESNNSLAINERFGRGRREPTG